MLCARVVLGIDSIAKATTPCARRRSMPSASLRGCRKPIRTVPAARRSTSAGSGLPTRTIPAQSAAASGATSSAPASRYASSVNRADVPAPRSTASSKPEAMSFVTASGVRATRCSPGADSRGTHTRIRR